MYTVTVKFDASELTPQPAPLAALRRESDGQGGWCVRVADGYLHAGPWLSYPSAGLAGPTEVRWSVDQGRHDLAINGVVVAVTGGSCELDGADTLYTNRDPFAPSAGFAGVVNAQIEGQP